MRRNLGQSITSLHPQFVLPNIYAVLYLTLIINSTTREEWGLLVSNTDIWGIQTQPILAGIVHPWWNLKMQFSQCLQTWNTQATHSISGKCYTTSRTGCVCISWLSVLLNNKPHSSLDWASVYSLSSYWLQTFVHSVTWHYEGETEFIITGLLIMLQTKSLTAFQSVFIYILDNMLCQ